MSFATKLSVQESFKISLFSKSTEDREEVDGDRENLLDTELLPAEDFPPDFPISLRNLDTDPALRIQR